MLGRIVQETGASCKFPTLVNSPLERGAALDETRPLLAVFISLYSLAMKQYAVLVLLVGILLVDMGALFTSPSLAGPWWTGFLILVPLGLSLLVWREYVWAAMGCTFYGTVGFALDLSTVVQSVTKDSEIFLPVLHSGVSGLLNFLLIVFGWRLFLGGLRVPPPQESRPPNPPSPS